MLSQIYLTFYYKILMLEVLMKAGLREKKEFREVNKKKLVLKPVL